MIKRFKILIPFFVIQIFLSACSDKKETPVLSDGIDNAFLENVQTVKASPENYEVDLTLTGKVTYDPDKVINYVPLISGMVERTYFSFGDKVSKGQTLLDIRSADLSALQSELISAEADVRIAGRELESAQSMHKDKILSERELIEAEAKLKQAEAVYSRVKNDLTIYDSKQDGSFSIRSPIDGFIVEKNVSSGMPVSPDNGALFVVADISTVWVVINVYAGNLMFVKEGMNVDITTLSYPGEIFTGKINSLSQVFDPEDKVLKARIKMPNTDLRLKPEMSVVVKLKKETPDKILSVPSEALVFDDNAYFIVVEDSPGVFEIREVELYGSHGERTYIHAGLKEDESVVVKNQLLIYSGLKNQ